MLRLFFLSPGLVGQSRGKLACLPGLRRLDRFVQFVLGGPKVFLGFRSVPGHVVMVGSASSLHLVNCFLYVLVDRFQIMPVVNFLGKRCAECE